MTKNHQIFTREALELIELAHEAILVCDLESRVTFWNNGAAEMYGGTKEEAAGQITHDLLQTQFPVSREAVYGQLLTQGRWEGELIHTRRDGVQIEIASRQRMPRNESGQPQTKLEINTDITTQKQAEARLQLAMENASLGLWDWDLITNQIHYDDHWHALLGYSPDELTQRLR